MIIGDNAFRLDTFVIKNIHIPAFQIFVYHILLLICKQKKGQIELFRMPDRNYRHIITCMSSCCTIY